MDSTSPMHTHSIKKEFFTTVKFPWTIRPLIQGPLSALLALDKFDQWYHLAKQQPGDNFIDQVLSSLNITIDVDEEHINQIPQEGPLIIIANQPFGGIESLILSSIIRNIRSDFKILANHFVSLVPELRNLFIFVNPLKTRRYLNPNKLPFNQAIDWVKEGSSLAIFPSGSVSHLHIRQRSVTDPPWRQVFGRLIETLQAPVIPMFFSGHNSKTFQTLGMIHPFFRTLRLPAEVFNKQNKVFTVHIGNLISPKQYNEYKSPRDLLSYFRRRTYNLSHRDRVSASEESVDHNAPEAIADPKPKKVILDELKSIPGEQFLHETEKEHVFYAMADQIPNLLHEIGRQREITFREVEEGTGRALDLDEFDQTYLHLVAWDKEKESIIGSYRLGLADEILSNKNQDPGLYTKTLFELKNTFLKKISPAIELGRSFVAPAYQRSFNSLFLLWRGIGEFIARRPHYRYLFGPVSISNAYAQTSQMLMLRYLKTHHHNPKMARWVKPQNPSEKPKKHLNRHGYNVLQMRELEEMISDIESQPSGVPVLIRQYIKLGAEFLAFNRDPLFSNVVDGLIVVDVHKTDKKVLNRYMGKDATKRYMEYQKEQVEKAANLPNTP